MNKRPLQPTPKILSVFKYLEKKNNLYLEIRNQKAQIYLTKLLLNNTLFTFQKKIFNILTLLFVVSKFTYEN